MFRCRIIEPALSFFPCNVPAYRVHKIPFDLGEILTGRLYMTEERSLPFVIRTLS